MYPFIFYRCDQIINPLTLEDGHFFHPSKENWKTAPDRRSAWRLEPYTYLWVPSVLLLAGLNITEFPKQFSIFFTVRLFNVSLSLMVSNNFPSLGLCEHLFLFRFVIVSQFRRFDKIQYLKHFFRKVVGPSSVSVRELKIPTFPSTSERTI